MPYTETETSASALISLFTKNGSFHFPFGDFTTQKHFIHVSIFVQVKIILQKKELRLI